MSGAYSEDLRVRLVRAVRAGMSARAAARLFEVRESSGVKWAQRFRKTGSVKPNAIRGHRHSPLDRHATWLLGLVEAEPDLTLEEIGRPLVAREGAVGRHHLDLALLRASPDQLKKKKRARRRARPRRRPQRQCLRPIADTSLTGERVVRELLVQSARTKPDNHHE
jgi:transposase